MQFSGNKLHTAAVQNILHDLKSGFEIQKCIQFPHSFSTAQIILDLTQYTSLMHNIYACR